MIIAPSIRNNRPLRRVLLSQVPADFADWLDYLAVAALLAYSWNADPIVFAWFAVALGLPYVLVGPAAGVLVDRWSILPVLIVSNVGRAAATACLALAGNWQALLALVFFRNCIDAFFTPAKQAAIQATTAPQDRMAANGVSHAINQASKIAAPAIGGALLIVLEPSQVFLVNAAVSLAAAALLLGLKPIVRQAAAEHAPEETLWRGIVDGWAVVARRAKLRAAILLMAGGFFALFVYDTQFPLLMRAFGFGGTELGMTLAAVGIGGVLASVYFGAAEVPMKPFHIIALGSVMSALAATWLGVAEIWGISMPFLVILGIFLVLGLSFAMTVVPTRTILQLETPPDRMARVTALSEAANTTALLIAPFVGAVVASATSVGAAFLLGGALLVVLAALAVRIEGRPAPRQP